MSNLRGRVADGVPMRTLPSRRALRVALDMLDSSPLPLSAIVDLEAEVLAFLRTVEMRETAAPPLRRTVRRKGSTARFRCRSLDS